MSNRILITSCTDALLWYNTYIGTEFTVYRIEITETDYLYWVREPSGYLNFVYGKDCKVV